MTLGAMRGIEVLVMLGVSLAVCGNALAVDKKPFRDSFKTATDGVTKGWLVESPWPDQDDTSQNWRTLAGRLVLSRHGHVIRKLEATTFWNWSFWAGGKEVVYEAGPVHGATLCVRVGVRTGRVLEEWPGDCRNLPDDAPAWVKAATGGP